MSKRVPYLVIINDKQSYVYSNSRKVNKIIKDNKNVEVYKFNNITRYNHWGDVYKLVDKNYELVKECNDDNRHYTDMGIQIMEWLARAEWKTTMEYPSNGWHICSICGDITNDISECYNCDKYVCWDCSYDVTNDCELGHFCSDECYDTYFENEYGIEYDMDESILSDSDMQCIIDNLDKEELIDIILFMHKENDEYDLYEEESDLLNNMTEKVLRDKLFKEYTYDDIYKTIENLYPNKIDDIIDANNFIDNLDPNDPADQWFFED